MYKRLGLVGLVLTLLCVNSQTLEKEVVVEDLRFVQQMLLDVHPHLTNQEQQRAFSAHAENVISEIRNDVSKEEAAILAQKVISHLKSAHDRVEFGQSSGQYLPLVFYWASDGLVVFADTLSELNIPPASEVLKVGNVDTATLESTMQDLISGNRYWVRQRTAVLLARKGLLRHLGVVDETNQVTLTLLTPEGKEETVGVPFTEQPGKSGWLNFLSPTYTGWTTGNSESGQRIFAWKVEREANRAIFKLYTCLNSKSYQDAVQSFFEEIEKLNVSNLIIDLRSNGGGDSAVMDSFLAHLPVSNLKIITGVQRLNETSLEQVQKLAKTDPTYQNLLETFKALPGQELPHEGDVYFSGRPGDTLSISEDQLLKPIFNGKIYILVNAETFSAAIDFAVMLSDNNLATIVGEPLGDAPTSSGNVILFTTPNLGISFKVSSSFYTRPDPSRDPAETLEPDIYLPLTVKDIQQQHDPVKVWLDGLE
jgi:hypothetical protein